MKWFKNKTITCLRACDTFWFRPMDSLPLSVFRFFVGLVVLFAYLIRFFDMRMFFYQSGMLSAGQAVGLHKEMWERAFHFVLASDMWLYFFYIMFIVLLFLMVLGVGGRLVSLLVFVLHLMFMHRNPSIVYGADQVSTFWLFYLVLASSNRQLKWIPYFVHKRRGLVSEGRQLGDALSTVALRLIQIQVCVIYFFSGFSKLMGTSWQEGTAIWEALSFYDLSWFDFSPLLLSSPALTGFLSLSVLLFEIYFPVLVWFRGLRGFMLSFGLVLHLGIMVSMGLVVFSPLMLAGYLVFLPPDSLRNVFKRLQKS